MVSVHDLISRKDYAKALRVLSAEMKKSPHDQRARLKYGDVLIMAGRQKEAVKVFLDLADHHTKEGFTAKAIAILKRVEKIEPHRPDVKGRLENLIHQKVNAAPSVPSAPAGGGGFEFGFEEIDDAAPEISLGMEPLPAEVIPEPVASDEDDLAGIEIEPEPEPAPAAKSFLQSPLFEGFTADDEMMAVIEGLNLATFEPGDVIVAEGAPGDSMFILTEGLMKVYFEGLDSERGMARPRPQGPLHDGQGAGGGRVHRRGERHHRQAAHGDDHGGGGVRAPRARQADSRPDHQQAPAREGDPEGVPREARGGHGSGDHQEHQGLSRR